MMIRTGPELAEGCELCVGSSRYKQITIETASRPIPNVMEQREGYQVFGVAFRFIRVNP
jgi:hypothetical protein